MWPAAPSADVDAASPGRTFAERQQAAGRRPRVGIYECLLLKCQKCREPMRIIAFVLDRAPATAEWLEMGQMAVEGKGSYETHEPDEPVLVPRAQ